MKKFTKKFALLFLVLGLIAACGQDSSNSSGNTGSNDSGVQGFDDGLVNDQSQPLNINDIRNAFASKAMSQGVTSGMQIYHAGPYFVTNGGNSGGGFSGGYCIDLGFWSSGDCQNSGSNYYEQQMRAAIQNGRLIQVVNANQSSVRYKRALDVQNGQFVFGNTGTYNANYKYYTEMLADGGFYGQANVVQATITLVGGTQVEGVGISNQYGVFVVSTNFPTIANPIFVGQKYGAYTNPVGALSQIGNEVRVQSISVPELSINFQVQ